MGLTSIIPISNVVGAAKPTIILKHKASPEISFWLESIFFQGVETLSLKWSTVLKERVFETDKPPGLCYL